MNLQLILNFTNNKFNCYEILFETRYMTIYDAVNDQSCLNNLLTARDENRYNFRKNNNLQQQRMRLKIGDNSFLSWAPKLWNELPNALRIMKRKEFKIAIRRYIKEEDEL